MNIFLDYILKVMGYCLLINIHEIIILLFSACIHCEPKRTKSSKKQHQLHVLAALVSTLAHTVHEGKSRVDLHELRRQFSSPENALCRVYTYGEFRAFSRAAQSDLVSICLY